MHRIKLLITGISGFIGRSLVEEIVNRDLPIDLYGIDIKQPVFNNPTYATKIDFTIVDIRNSEDLRTYFQHRHFDGVVHLAAVSRVVDAENDKPNCIAVNYNGTKHLVELLANMPETWLIFGSSREVYGEQKLFPVKETAHKQPINIYGECKLKGEEIIKEKFKRYAILRFSNVYGNNYDIEGRVIPTFVKRALEDEVLYLEGGEQTIDFTHISDTVGSIIDVILLLQNNRIVTEEIHISPGRTNKITDIIRYLEQLTGKKPKVQIRQKRNYDVEHFVGDSSHREQILGKKTFQSLYEGIEQMIKHQP